MSLPKTYEPNQYEAAIYKQWVDSGAFLPHGKGEPFSIILPPPNATGELHLGHTVMIAIEDTLVRFARMQGRETVWIPGTDHAAIATENVVIKKLKDDGMADPRKELGREELLKQIQQLVSTSQETMRKQIRSVGASVDWSRERYTMEPALNNIVRQVFVKMFHDDLIYRGKRIVNWDPNLQTTVSDDEVEHKDNTTPFYTLQYGPFQIGTARPETKFGDKYVVMHPDDTRYSQWKHGQKIDVDWLKGKVTATVIKDEAVDPDFGTGVMTITPWHDATDFEIAQRHDLKMEQIIGLDGHLLDIAGEFKSLAIEEARPKIVEFLKEKGLLVSVDEKYEHRTAHNSRGGGLIEPQIMEQWFVDVNKQVVRWKGKKRSLKEIMHDVVAEGDIQLIPDRFNKTYYHWIDNLHDWCISRQIWWGHRIPAWYRDTRKVRDKNDKTASKNKVDDVVGYELYVGLEPPEGAGWKQDPDTLDTWFSSGLWAWSTLTDKQLGEQGLELDKLLKKSPDFKKFHPTTILETGYDILFFWVARMILMTTYAVGDVPFKTVYLHGMVRTRDGKKMSKSNPETAIDPLEIIPEFGADALRLSMLIGQSPGSDNRLYKEKIAGYRNFCNKLWNVGRFITDTAVAGDLHKKPDIDSSADAWMHNRVQQAVTRLTKHLQAYRISDAGQDIYSLLWDDFADWYIEASKVTMNGPLVAELFRTILKLVHPMAPFVTEVLWQHIGDGTLLAQASWPEATKLVHPEKAAGFDEVIKIVTEIRELQAELQLTHTSLYYKDSEFLDENGPLVVKLTGIEGAKKVVDGSGLHLTQTTIDCWLAVEENVTRNYLFKLIRKRDIKAKQMATFEQKLASKPYIQNAPKELVAETKQKLTEATTYRDRLNKQIENLEHLIKLYQ